MRASVRTIVRAIVQACVRAFGRAGGRADVRDDDDDEKNKKTMQNDAKMTENDPKIKFFGERCGAAVAPGY